MQRGKNGYRLETSLPIYLLTSLLDILSSYFYTLILCMCVD